MGRIGLHAPLRHRDISIHPPRAGWDLPDFPAIITSGLFQSTHPVRGGTGTERRRSGRILISIHPPRAGWDPRLYNVYLPHLISIHPPRAGWDLPNKPVWVVAFHFNPPTPCGVGLVDDQQIAPVRVISIHPPRAGWDRCGTSPQAEPEDFNPPTPCGVGRSTFAPPGSPTEFQSTHPVRGGTSPLRSVSPLL